MYKNICKKIFQIPFPTIDLLPIKMFAKTCCLGSCTGIYFVDSTPIRVCKNKRITRNKVFKDVATTGKSTMGWFHGFKLHIVINDKGYISDKLHKLLFVDGIELITVKFHKVVLFNLLCQLNIKMS